MKLPSKNPMMRAAPIVMAAALAAVTGIAPVFAATSVTIYACVTTKTGAMRSVSNATSCDPKTETFIFWNQAGPVGPAGPTGATGPEGPAGLTGPAGATGATGA